MDHDPTFPLYLLLFKSKELFILLGFIIDQKYQKIGSRLGNPLKVTYNTTRCECD